MYPLYYSICNFFFCLHHDLTPSPFLTPTPALCNILFCLVYVISVDKEFIQAAVEGKILLREQMPKMMQEETKLFMTRCILEDLRKGGKAYKGAHTIAASLPFLKCRHGKGLREPGKCIWALIAHGNPDFLLVAAQNQEIRRMVRSHPGVPTLYINGSVPLLEPPSLDTKRQQKDLIKQHNTPSMPEKKALDNLKGPSKIEYKKKRVKGTNP